MAGEQNVIVSYFSDLLCVWAYVAEARLDELRRNFGSRVSLEHRFASVFGNTARKIAAGWADRGGYAGYAKHVRDIVRDFGHVEVHPDVWTRNIPAGSTGAHAFVKAVTLLSESGDLDPQARPEYGGRTVIDELSWRLRLALFRDLKDVGRLDTQVEIAEALELPIEAIRARLEDGRALAALADDQASAERWQVAGSPTFVLNEGRQKLYGNVGYRIIEANVQELLQDRRDMASWC